MQMKRKEYIPPYVAVPDSIFITPEGHYTSPYRDMAPYYDPWKDVVIPGFMDSRKDTYAVRFRICCLGFRV